MALSGVRSSWLIVARKRDLARFASSALTARLVGDRLRLFKLGDQRILLCTELQHGDDGGVEPLHQPDEIDIDADSHRRHRPIERIVEHGEANDNGDGHRQGAGIDDRHDRRCEQHPHRDDDKERGEDESMRGFALGGGADEGYARPAHAVEEFGRAELFAPYRRPRIVARRLDELPAQADEDALGHEHGGEPYQVVARRCPEHGAHGDDDGKKRSRDRG